MKERPFKDQSTADVYRKAQRAACAADAHALDLCLGELRHRKGGAAFIADLKEVGVAATLGDSLPVGSWEDFAQTDLAEFAVFTDAQCHRREVLLRNARSSIWLSTYSTKDFDGKFRDILGAKAQRGISVNLIASVKPSRSEHAVEVLDDLRQAKVRVKVTTNHSKCLVVDGEVVVIGSANLHTSIFRDVGVQFRSTAVANMLIRYMEELWQQPDKERHPSASKARPSDSRTMRKRSR